MNTTNTSTSYSGAHAHGLNLQASYDRVYLTGEYASLGEVMTAWQNAFTQFISSNRTRLVCNMQIPISVMQEIMQQPDCFSEGTIEALYPYPSSTNRAGYANVIIGVNRENRRVRDTHIQEIRHRVQTTLDENGFDLSMQLRRIQELIHHGYRFTTDIQSQQLHELWGETFGRSLPQVEHELQNNPQRIIGLVDENNMLVSCAMLSQGESTEWTTRPGLQRRGLIQPLLLVLHAANIQRDMQENNAITPITCEARYDRSVRVGAQIGMTADQIQGTLGIHPNHVTIGGSAPDERNTNRGITNAMDFSQLRSFVTMYLGEEMYDEQRVRNILEAARLY